MKILMVTREREDDRKYGLGKSLAPIIAILCARGVGVGYLSQEDLGVRASRTLVYVSNLLAASSQRKIISQRTRSLAYAVAERLNMGRLAAKVARNDGYTHVHCHDPIIAWGFLLFGGVSGRRHKWGITEHGFGSYTQALHDDGAPLSTRRMRYLRRLELSILRRAHWVISPTRSALAELSRDLAAYPTPSHWHTIPHPRPNITRYEKREAREHLGWTQSAFYIIGVGRLAPLKNFGALIRACATATHQDLRLVIIGEGDSAPLLRIASTLGIEKRVTFTVTDDISFFYSAADLYVSTSLTEAFGMANLEALAAGIPALCSTAGAVPDVVGTSAYLFPAGDDTALEEALQRLIDSPQLRAEIARRGLYRAAHWPTSSEVAERYLTCYQRKEVPAERRSRVEPSGDTGPMPVWKSIIDSLAVCPLPNEWKVPAGKRVLVFAPHPDDEVLACGGTLALMRQNNCHIRVVIMTDGALGDPKGYFSDDITERRYAESRAALKMLGIDDLVFLGYPDCGLSCNSETIKSVRIVLDEFQPDVIFLPPLLDHHRDHVAASLAVLHAWHGHCCKARAFMWELWQALPVNCVTDITSVYELRQSAARCYSVAMRYCDYTHANSGLAAYRGLYLETGSQAEGFLAIEERFVWSVMDQLLNLRVQGERTSTADEICT